MSNAYRQSQAKQTSPLLPSAEANFSRVTFSTKDILDFSRAAFSWQNSFFRVHGTTYFNYVLFENPNQIIFDKNDMSKGTEIIHFYIIKSYILYDNINRRFYK